VRQAAPEAEVVALFKPQFEVGKAEVGKGGIVRDPLVIEGALGRFKTWCGGHGYAVAGEAASELTGAEGNQEYFFHLAPQ
jgi:23S rRNA (cytidine1920-2'-O)/16S rRNA (cytidine1409-2'-O)-methyltransferase